MQVLHLWSERQASSTLKFLMSKVLLWQQAGYVSKDVWHEMDKIVGAELLPSQEEINEKSDISLEVLQQVQKDHVTVETENPRGIDAKLNSDELFEIITKSIFPSKRKRFALQALGLEESEYDQNMTETIRAQARNNMVFFENDIYFKEILISHDTVLNKKMRLRIETLIILQVMDVWCKRTGDLKVRDCIETIATWVKAGFVSPDVWLDLKEYVRSDVLHDYIETTSVEKKPEDAASDCKTSLR